MAKEIMITRTVNTYDHVFAKVEKHLDGTYAIAGDIVRVTKSYPMRTADIKKVKAELEIPDHDLIDVEVQQKKMGMTLSAFIAHAEEII